MRTVDPEVWSKRMKDPTIDVTRRLKFGQKRLNSFETCVRSSFIDSMKEFLEESSLAGTKNWVNDDIQGWARYVGLVMLLVLGVVGVCATCVDVLSAHGNPPLLVNQQSGMNSIEDMPFPAVALCPNNLFSEQKLCDHTQFLVNHPANKRYNFTAEDVRCNLLAFGALLTRGLPRFHINFMQFLTEVDPHFNVTDLMFQLSPACSSLLVQCSWRGALQPCDELFAVRATQLGFCCVFNSRYQPEDYETPPKFLDLVGQDFGLGAIIKENRSDKAFSRRPSDGMEMLLFDGAQYPLLQGGARLYPLAGSSSLFVPLATRAQRSASDVRYFSEQWTRRSVGQVWCLTACLLRTVTALCGCAPFGLTPATPTRPAAAPCSLADLACLDKHSEKFKYFYPGSSEHPQLREELQASLDCPECAPDCDRVTFSAEVFASRRKPKILQNFLSEGVPLVNATVLRLFYMTEHQQLLAVESRRRWYEGVAWFACRLLLLPGLPLAGTLELMFHCTFRWRHHYKRRTALHKLI